MSGVTAVILLHPARDDDPPLTALLRDAQRRLAERHVRVFRSLGADAAVDAEAGPFAQRLRRHARMAVDGGIVALGGGGVPLLTGADARRLVATASAAGREALTNNRYSSDVCALAHASTLLDLPDLAADNALPRWLEEHARYRVAELPARERLALDVDTPLDLALVALHARAPVELTAVARGGALTVPRLDELRAVAVDPRRELLVFGRSSSRTLAWLERHVRCRVRFLAEERGLRAAGLAVQRAPRATLGRLLDARGPDALASTVAELADGAVIDSRVLLADRLGADEEVWPSPEDRFASDLLRDGSVADPWLAALTRSAAGSAGPILLGGHTLVGPGLQLVFNAPDAPSGPGARSGIQAR